MLYKSKDIQIIRTVLDLPEKLRISSQKILTNLLETTILKRMVHLKVCPTLITLPFRDFPGGTMVKNLPANAGDMGSSPGPGRSHMLWSN